MARQNRIDGAGARHHITSHVISELGELDYTEMAIFETAVEQAAQRFPIRLHAYCIMRNHLHLAVECETPAISAFMKLTLQLCAQRLNKHRQRRGPVFDRRFFNQVMERDAHWMHLIAYIHLNPVSTVHDDAASYRWSSARAYSDPAEKPDWLVTDEFIAAFGTRAELLKYVEHTKRRRLDTKAPQRPRTRQSLFRDVRPSGTDIWPPDFRRPDRHGSSEQSLQ